MISDRHVAKKPEDVGIDSERLEALFARVRRDVEQKSLTSAQIAVARQGKLAAIRTFGTAVQGGVAQPATDRTLYPIFSCTKGIVGIATWALFEEGLLHLSDRVADIIPEFGANGKGAVTVEQVLLHLSGFPNAPMSPEQHLNRDQRLEAFAQWGLTSDPGAQFAYHITSAHWVLAELIRRRTGMDHRDFIRERLALPMGLDELFVGLPSELDARVAEFRLGWEPAPPPGGWGETSPEMLLVLNQPEARRIGLPGGGGIASAAELAMFYQPLVNGGNTADGRRIFKQETIDFATTVRTTAQHVDPLYGNVPVNRGLGVIVAGNDGFAAARGFGRTTSPRAFGHPGAGGQIAWGDPATGISVGYCLDVFTDWMSWGRRTTAICSLAANCCQS